MNLADRISGDLKTALKAGPPERLGVLRLLISEIHNRQKDKFGAGDGALADEEIIALLQKEVKKRREAVELFRKGGRQDLIKKDEAEIAIIQEYLPKAMSPEEIMAFVDGLISGGFKDFNSAMKEAAKELRGRADGKAVADLIRKRLG